MKRRWHILIISIILVLVIAIYLSFFYLPKCNDIVCWEAKFSECNKAKYISNPIDVTWEYKVKGKSDGKCEVDVKVLDIKRGLKKTEILIDKEMTCYLPLGATSAPEANINLCTGTLKEEMQDLIIQKLHEYVVQNIGEISDELTQVEGLSPN